MSNKELKKAFKQNLRAAIHQREADGRTEADAAGEADGSTAIRARHEEMDAEHAADVQERIDRLRIVLAENERRRGSTEKRGEPKTHEQPTTPTGRDRIRKTSE